MSGRRRHGIPLLLPILLGAATDCRISAQTASPTPEIRRALPVDNTASLGEIPVRKALPVPAQPAAPRTTPIPNPAPAFHQPSPSSATAPISSGTRPSPESTGTATPGTIRIAPSDPAAAAAAQLALADGEYTAKHPGSAVTAYEKYLVMAEKADPSRERTLYRLGECQRLMGSTEAAETSFRSLLRDFPAGSFVPAASYRLGELREAAGDHAGASECFAVTAKGASNPMIRLAALHNGGLALEQAGKTAEAAEAFTKAAGTESGENGENPYRVPSLLRLAAMAAGAKENAKALGYYHRILDAKPPAEIAEEAAMKAARLELEAGHTDEAVRLYREVAEAPSQGRWKGEASLALLKLTIKEGGDDGGPAVLKACDLALANDRENAPEILLVRANALRKSGNPRQSLADYDRILREFPGSKAAAEAPFQRLVALNASGSPSLDQEIDSFLLTASDPGQRARVRLLKAEQALRAGHYKEAAALYHDLPASDLPTTSLPDIRYKEAWALLQSGDHAAAIAGLGAFVEQFPDDQRAPAALAERAILHQQDRKLEEALADFSRLAERYPKAAERETALDQKALLLGQLQRNSEMTAAFAQLLKDYPGSNSAPRARYWTGWAALGNKDYAGALPELEAARKGDPKEFGERAGLRILLCHYSLDHPSEAMAEAMKLKTAQIPPEVAEWLGMAAVKAGSPEKAERFLAPLAKPGGPGAQNPAILTPLASALIAEGKSKEALPVATACLKLARDPAERAKALLVTASLHRSLGEFSEASAQVDEAMLLQPEGPVNSEARLLAGDLLASKKDYAAAAKAYMTVAVLSDDPTLAPKALALAAEAYGKSGNLLEARKAIDELHSRFPKSPSPRIPGT